MTRLKVTDTFMLKLDYEIQQFQPEDNAFDIVEILINDEIHDDYTVGYFTAHLEISGSTVDGKELMIAIYNLAKIIKHI